MLQYDIDFMLEHEELFDELARECGPAYVHADMVFLAAVKSIEEGQRIGVYVFGKGL